MKRLSRIFLVLGLALGLAAAALAFACREAEPLLLGAPAGACAQAETVLDSLRTGEYDTLQAALFGQPELGLDGENASVLTLRAQKLYRESITCRFTSAVYPAPSGLAVDVEARVMDLPAMLEPLEAALPDRVSKMIAGGAPISEILEENGQYREEFLLEALAEELEAQWAEHPVYTEKTLTLHLKRERGGWYVMPERELLSLAAGTWE